MKYIFTLFLLLVSSAATACSYAHKPPSDALADFDLIFNAQLRAVYVDDIQVSTDVLRDYLSEIDGAVTLKYRLVPTHFHLGAPVDEIDVHIRYSSWNTCSNFYVADPTETLWGVTKYDNQYYTNSIHSWRALAVRSLLQALREYQAELYDVLSRTNPESLGFALLGRELNTINQQLTDWRTSLLHQLAAEPRELAALPVSTLKERSKVLEFTDMKKELAKTSMAIIQQPPGD